MTSDIYTKQVVEFTSYIESLKVLENEYRAKIKEIETLKEVVSKELEADKQQTALSNDLMQRATNDLIKVNNSLDSARSAEAAAKELLECVKKREADVNREFLLVDKQRQDLDAVQKEYAKKNEWLEMEERRLKVLENRIRMIMTDEEAKIRLEKLT